MDNGDIYLDNYKGWYSVSDETFYNEKDLIKQSDGLLKLLLEVQLIGLKKSHIFLNLSKYSEKLLKLI
jgi:methionyl-tRNA synthetase